MVLTWWFSRLIKWSLCGLDSLSPEASETELCYPREVAGPFCSMVSNVWLVIHVCMYIYGV